jgi:toxin-antitoxin system PIN domain toxin
MRVLLDINVLIALLDPDHVFHQRAHQWWAANEQFGWASCPLTENGVIRIVSNPTYSRGARFTPGGLISRLQQFSSQTNHEFWEDDISFRDAKIFSVERIHGSRQLADLYLLALAANHKGKLATFDQGIALSAVPVATAGNLCVI